MSAPVFPRHAFVRGDQSRIETAAWCQAMLGDRKCEAGEFEPEHRVAVAEPENWRYGAVVMDANGHLFVRRRAALSGRRGTDEDGWMDNCGLQHADDVPVRPLERMVREGRAAELSEPRSSDGHLADLPAPTLVYIDGVGTDRRWVILDRCEPVVLRAVPRRERAVMRALLNVALMTLDEAERSET